MSMSLVFVQIAGVMQSLPLLTNANKKEDRPPGGVLPFAPEALLHALPHPVLVLRPDNRIVYANFAAEVFFSVSEPVLRRRRIDDLVAFASPLLALIAQVRQSHATVNEYDVDLGLSDANMQQSVDEFAA